MVAAAGALEMTGGQRVELEGLARSHTAPAREVRQAEALLWATDGVSNAEIARRCASTPKSVRRWLAGSPRREPLRWGASGKSPADKPPSTGSPNPRHTTRRATSRMRPT